MFSKIQPPMDEEAEGEHVEPHGVAVLLKETRRQRGEDLRTVSEALRIRYLYLAAIEKGDFDELPGAIYAVGFIRTYAEHLGLDGEEIILMYKAETGNDTASSELTFPVPVSENEIPGGAILFIAVLIGVLAYGGWYIRSSKDEVPTDRVSAVPEAISGATEKKDKDKETPTASAPKEDTEQPNKSTDTTDTNEDFLVGLEKKILKIDKTETEKPSEAPQKKITSPTPAKKPAPKPAKKPKKKIEKTEKVAKNPTETTSPLQEDPAPKATTPDEVPSSPQMTDTEEPPAPAEETSVPIPDPGPQADTPDESKETPSGQTVAGRVFGADKKNSRIIVRAKKNSWIQVRDDISKKLLMTRLLRRGDSYRVPDRKGLRLLTGNVSALEIIIDGKAAPALKGGAAIRSSIALNVKKLLEGSAVTD